MSTPRFPPIIQLRKPVAALYRHGYPAVAQSIVRGISRVILVDDDDDWQLFQVQMAHHQRAAWFGEDMDAFLDDENLYCTAISYRHVDYRIRRLDGATLNEAQWQRLRTELLDTCRRVHTNRFVLWLDRVLHCSESLFNGTSWVTRGVMPYITLPVLYIGGPDEQKDEASKNRLWPSIERYCALTSGGISMRGTMEKRTTESGGNLRISQSLFWIAARIVAGTFNTCELSWEHEYTAFREMSLRILSSENPTDTIDNFIKGKQGSEGPYKLVSVAEAFDLSKDSNLLLSSGQRSPYLGTYLGGKITKAQTEDGSWHGIREWVQYRWTDGTLTDERFEDLERMKSVTRWGLFTDSQRKGHVYALGIVSADGELQAMGVAHLKNISRDGNGTVLWFQRGVASQSYSFARFISKELMPNPALVNSIGVHWGVSLGESIALVQGKKVHWKWNSR